MRHISRQANAIRLSMVVAIAIANASCAVRLVADYDQEVDRAATSLQQEMDAHLTNLQLLEDTSTQASYDQQKQFYAAYGVKLRSLRVRASGSDKNEITVEQLDRMSDSLEKLRAVHQQQGRISNEFASDSRVLFNTSWAAIIKLEMAKRRHT